METWEYRTLQIEATGFMGGIVDLQTFQGELNALGKEGWELVSCFDTNMNQGQTRYVIAIFKRKRLY
ncbi:MAG: DUF4177 domain-containing protein [Clostridia bacterium]|nr:DUF4177 domain-containing protein [Clostridia bacterium]